MGTRLSHLIARVVVSTEVDGSGGGGLNTKLVIPSVRWHEVADHLQSMATPVGG